MRDDAGRTGQAGFTLLEAMIAAVLLFIMITVAARMLATGQKLLGVASIASEGDVRAQAIADRIAERMRNGILATLLDRNGIPVADGTTVYDGFMLAVVDSKAQPDAPTALDPSIFPVLRGGPVARRWVAFLGVPDGETNAQRQNKVDEDGDNVWDEGAIQFRESDLYPVASPLPAYKVKGLIGRDCGVFDYLSTTDPKRVLGTMVLTRNANRLTLTVGVLRADPLMRESDGKPVVRNFRATTYVTLKN